MSITKRNIGRQHVQSQMETGCCFSFITGDGRRPRQGPVTRAMIKHLKVSEESKAPAQIKMMTILSFEDHLKIVKISIGKFSSCK